MRTRFLRGDRAQNDGLTLQSGELAVDSETRALRLHDGSTLGGYEIIGTRAFEPYAQIVAGDETAGFYGEVPKSDFISYDELASVVGLSAGTSEFNTESAWLKFALDGKTLYVAKKPARYNLSWEHVYQAGCVYGVDGFGSNPSGSSVDQGVFVTIAGQDYRVRLLKGAGADPTVVGSDSLTAGWDIDLSHGSEWNRLLYPIHSGAHADTQNPTTHSDPNAAPFGSWASYSDSDIIVHTSYGSGAYTWCQETHGSNSNYRYLRGAAGITRAWNTTSTNVHTSRGWRPVLERIA